MKLEHRDDFGKFLTYHGFTGKGVEVGTFKGEFAKTILSNWNGTLYMIDPWRGLNQDYIDSSNHYNHNNVYFECINNLAGYEDRSFMLRGLSHQLINLFEDNSLDFVYIDGNHAYDFVVEDIELWFKKVKTGGLVSGHDYILFNGTKESWYNDPWHENGKDKHIWTNDGTDKPMSYAGIFGVNTAVDEFGHQNNYEINHTNEFFSSWYFFK